MKVLIAILFELTIVACKDSTIVYVCDSPNANRYHNSKTCRGLSNCTYRVIGISLSQAKKTGKSPCRWETNLDKDSE